MIRVAYIVSHIYSENDGGVQRVTHLLERSLLINDISVFYFVHDSFSNKTDRLSYFHLPDKQLYSQKNIDFISSTCSIYNINIIINQLGLNIEYIKLGKILRNFSKLRYINCIHGNPFYIFKSDDLELKKEIISSKSKHLEFIKKNIYPLYLYLIKNKYKRLFKLLNNNSDSIVFLSSRYLDMYVKFNRDIKSSLVSIYNPIEENIDIVEFNEKKNIITICSRMVYHPKRIDFMLLIWEKVCSKISNWKLEIIGDGPYLDYYINYAKDLSLTNICFLGHMNPSNNFKYSKICCNVSTHEGYPMSLIEAQSYGNALFSFNTYPAIYDIINDNGYIIEQYDIDDYANKLITLMLDEKKLQKFYHNSLINSKKHNSIDITKQWISLFKQLNKNIL